MSGEITFTVGQLFVIIGTICLVVFTIYLVGVLRELRKTLKQINETAFTVNEMIEDIQATKMVITSRLADLKRFTDFSKTFKEMKEKFTRKKKKKKGED